jgi:4-amino-4-deoxy-L-arabinose transferase-like glycosyltransferase
VNFIQNMLQVVEVGKGQVLVRLIPLSAAILVLILLYDFSNFRGLNDPQSMDNAQLARQIAHGHGFTTKFLRPYALTQLHDYWASRGGANQKVDLFPASQFPPDAPRILPDTYNAPGYPYLLAAWFTLVHPEFDQTSAGISAVHNYSGDRWIPPFNQIFMFLTALMVFALGLRLFDERVAWMSLIAYLATDLVWHYSTTALSTTFLMFLITGLLLCALEIFCVGETCLEDEARSFVPAVFWSLALALLLAMACLTRLHLLIILVPLFVALMFMPRANIGLPILITLIVAAAVTPWFLHMTKISGTPLGSNTPLLLYGEGDYAGNQIYCSSSIPDYEQLFKAASKKETVGFGWYFEHFWSLLGSNPMILFFGASLLHFFKRSRTRLFQWLVFGCALFIILANNLGNAKPETISAWNTLVLLFPCMVVLGSAFFFILLDRLNIQIQLLRNIIVTAMAIIIALPLVITVTNPIPMNYSFPPYMPPLIKVLGQYAQPNEWVTSDMPWATAWYADRASLWLPDSISDFNTLHDTVCPTGILLLTPVSWAQPVSTFTSGEYKDWWPFVEGLPVPANFPLAISTQTAPGGPDYHIWSDRPRWQGK